MVVSLRWVEQNVLCVDLDANTSYVQDNILITRDGNACLGDFGVTNELANLYHRKFKLRTARYMAPERFDDDDDVDLASKESDIYSLAMSSFTVRSSVGKQSNT